MLRREATAERWPCGPIAAQTRFGFYLRDDLAEKGILLPNEGKGACGICDKRYRSKLPGSVRLRCAVPCGHWFCEPCAEEFEQHLRYSTLPPACPLCRHPLKEYKGKAYPGQCIAPDDDLDTAGTTVGGAVVLPPAGLATLPEIM